MLFSIFFLFINESTIKTKILNERDFLLISSFYSRSRVDLFDFIINKNKSKFTGHILLILSITCILIIASTVFWLIFMTGYIKALFRRPFFFSFVFFLLSNKIEFRINSFKTCFQIFIV